MKRRTGKSVSAGSVCLLVWLLLEGGGPSFAQEFAHVYLPPAFGATPMSTLVDAQARYLVAQGDCMEYFAVARKINAEAYAVELKNSVDEVDAYFKRRELNRLWRRKENPSYLDHLKLAENTREKVMREQFDTFCQRRPDQQAQLASGETLRPCHPGPIPRRKSLGAGPCAGAFGPCAATDLDHRRRP